MMKKLATLALVGTAVLCGGCDALGLGGLGGLGGLLSLPLALLKALLGLVSL